MPSSDHSAADAAYDLQPTVWPEDEEAPSAESVPSGFLPPSEVLGRYVVLYRLGTGGMGVVYAAYDPELDRKVALKLLRRFSNNKKKRERAQNRLLEEARAMARLSHANVITVHDVALVGGRVVVAMEFIDGQTLSSTLMKGETDWRKTVTTMVQAGRGLAAAHDAGIVHRDFKPDNVMLGKDGRVVVMDFGLARALDLDVSSGGTRSRASMHRSDILDEAESHRGLRRISSVSKSRPKTRVVGTPAYMAPEQHRGESVDGRTDQFSFCVTLYEALYGHRPFRAEKPKELLKLAEKGELPPPPSHTKVPGWIRSVIVRGLSPDPADRFASMEHLLRALQDDPATRRRRAFSIGGTVIAIGLASTGAWAWHDATDARCEGGTERLEGVWDDGQRREVEQAFKRSGKTYAAASWQAVEGAIDGYTQRWLEMHREVCEATHVRGEQSGELMDLRMDCLGRRLAELEALTAVFADADAALVESGVSAIGKLVPVAVCADTELLKAPVKPPDDPQIRIRIDEVRDQIARAKAHEDAGRAVRGVAIARSALERAKQLDYAPVLAEAHLQAGRLELLSGMSKEAEQSLREAVMAAARGHHDEAAARAWVVLVHATGYGRGKFEQAREVLQAAEAAVERAGRPAETEGTLRSAEGVLLIQEGELEASEAAFEAALEAHRRARGEAPPMAMGGVLNNLAGVQLMQGRFEEAERTFAEAIELASRLLGTEHPMVAIIKINVGTAAAQRGEFERGLKIIDGVIEVLERADYESNPDYVRALAQRGTLQRLTGDLEGAESTLRDAVEGGRTLLAGHPHSVNFSMALGRTLNDAKKYEHAAAVLSQEIERAAPMLGDEHEIVAGCRVELAAARAGQGHTGEARALLEQAMPNLDENDSMSDYAPRAHLLLAQLLHPRDPQASMKHAQKARELYLALPPQHYLRQRAQDVQAWLDEQSARQR